MLQDFVVTVNHNTDIFKDKQMKDGAATYTIDFRPWAEVNGAVTTVTWTVRAGDATVSGTSLTSSVATGLVTFPSAGGNLIQVKATNGTETYVAYLDIFANDPLTATNDYEL